MNLEKLKDIRAYNNGHWNLLFIGDINITKNQTAADVLGTSLKEWKNILAQCGAVKLKDDLVFSDSKDPELIFKTLYNKKINQQKKFKVLNINENTATIKHRDFKEASNKEELEEKIKKSLVYHSFKKQIIHIEEYNPIEELNLVKSLQQEKQKQIAKLTDQLIELEKIKSNIEELLEV